MKKTLLIVVALISFATASSYAWSYSSGPYNYHGWIIRCQDSPGFFNYTAFTYQTTALQFDAINLVVSNNCSENSAGGCFAYARYGSTYIQTVPFTCNGTVQSGYIHPVAGTPITLYVRTEFNGQVAQSLFYYDILVGI